MVKVDLVTGFLGAGKTTFIKYYVQWLKQCGNKVEIIENEFGMAGVDSELLSREGVKPNELSGGCICCSLKVDFALLLVNLASRADRIVVEPSGIFTLDQFYSVMSSPAVKKCCEVGAVITIVDVLSLPELDSTSLTVLASQLRGTGCVLLSKTGGLTPGRIESAVRLLLELVPEEDITGRIDAKEWEQYSAADFEQLSAYASSCSSHDNPASVDHQRIFNSITVYKSETFSRIELNKALEAVMDGSCGRIIRIKGYVTADTVGSYIVNCTPGCVNITDATQAFKPMLNIIGTGVSRKACEAVLSASRK